MKKKKKRNERCIPLGQCAAFVIEPGVCSLSFSLSLFFFLGSLLKSVNVFTGIHPMRCRVRRISSNGMGQSDLVDYHLMGWDNPIL